ncbi:peptidylprolyl isomerase [bacterium]|nr:peptidylprolyl isomerase [bacterium]
MSCSKKQEKPIFAGLSQEQSDLIFSFNEAIDSLKIPTKPDSLFEKITASNILIAYKNAYNAPPELSRTKEEAKAIAEKLVLVARQKNVNFHQLSQKFSDDASAGTGGKLGGLKLGDLPPECELALWGMNVGQVSDVVETNFGFHIFLREKVVLANALHLLISYKGAKNPNPNFEREVEIVRTKEEAKELIEELTSALKSNPKVFQKYVSGFSDDTATKLKDGELGEFCKGELPEDFENAIFSVNPNEVTNPIETPYGFHVFLRIY